MTAEKQLATARATVERSQSDLLATVAELKSRLAPANLASDAWSSVKHKGSQASGQGLKAVTEHPGPAGGAIVALALFFLRSPLANLLARIFGGKEPEGLVKTDILDKDKDFDLTAPVVVPDKGSNQ